MIHLKRFLWLAAWSVWVWLGFGLYRELPRDLGQRICELPLGSREWPIGFIGNWNEIVTHQRDPDTRKRTLRRRDAITGKIIAEIKNGPLGDPRRFALGFSPNNEHLVCGISGGRGIGDPAEERERTLLNPGPLPTDVHHVLDIRAGTWRNLPYPISFVAFHSEKPIGAFFNFARMDQSGYVHVVDLHSGRRLFEWKEPGPREARRRLADFAFFYGDDRIVIPTGLAERGTDGPEKTLELEVWRIEPPKILERTVSAPISGVFVSDAPSCARVVSRLGDSIAVFDLDAERVVFACPLEERRERLWRFEGEDGLEVDTLSPDGRTLMRANSDRLIAVDAGKLLWEPRREEYVLWTRGSRFETYESWRVVTPWWWKRFETFAVRDLRDGSALYRAWRPTLRHQFESNGPQLMIDTGSIYLLPARVNYPLLALCQTILALPLVLMWAVLHWRRRRKAIRTASG
jgi:hypothetical protein